MTPFLPKKRDGASSSEFELDLIDYLDSYGDKLKNVRNKVKEYDFSTVKVNYNIFNSYELMSNFIYRFNYLL